MTIINGKDLSLQEATPFLPNMANGVAMFLQVMKVFVVTKKQVMGYTEEETECVITKAVRVPLNPKQLEIKPEGQRAWSWSQLHTLTDLKIRVDDIVIIRDIRYRVMAINNYAEYGFYDYHLVEDYNNEQACD